MTDEIKSKLGQMLYLASDGYSCRDEFAELCQLIDTEITAKQATIDKLVAALEEIAEVADWEIPNDGQLWAVRNKKEIASKAIAEAREKNDV